LAYCTAILRVYNLHGRRDNKFKARIKILVHEIGVEEMTRRVEEEFASLGETGLALPADAIAAITAYFSGPALAARPEPVPGWTRANAPGFSEWVERDVDRHRRDDHAIVTLSLKGIGETPGDASAEQMDAVADLAEAYGYGEIRVSHEPNQALPHVARADLHPAYQARAPIRLATANAGPLTD